MKAGLAMTGFPGDGEWRIEGSEVPGERGGGGDGGREGGWGR
jgi:hypothetical protein